MTDPSMTPETPDVAETVNFLRRFAELMSVGQNASYLHRAAVLLETLSVRVSTAAEEEQLWRYKHETAAHQADMLEIQCEALKHDIDGHLVVISTILSERDALKETLQAREAEVAGLRDDLDRERDEFTIMSKGHDETLAALRVAFDREREALKATAEARGKDIDQLRQEMADQSKVREAELAELRLAFDRERGEHAARLRVSEDELAALRVVSRRECDALREKIATLEAKRAELRSAFDRIGDLKNQTVEPQGAAELDFRSAQPAARNLLVGEADAVVPKATLRQVRAQFAYLASEFTGVGDVASQVMCELGAFTMDMALGDGRTADPLPVGDVALSILASPGSAAPAGADTR